MNKIIKFLKSKTFYIASALLIQLIALFLLVTYFSQRFVGIYYILVLLSWIVSLRVINRESDTSSKMLWILLIMSLPFFGGLVYLLFGERKIPKALMIQDRQAYSDYKIYATRNIELMNESHEDDYVLDKMVSMAWSNGFFPVYKNCKTIYFPSGEEQYKMFIEELVKAKDFIFMEFFIINKGVMWNTILQILLDKASEGVDVRLIYDDAGSITYLDPDYPDWLNARGIKTHLFNPMKPQLAMQMNNRDHRKILVIDGKVAFMIDGGMTKIGVESTVCKVIDGIPTILRPGKITPQDIEAVVGVCRLDSHLFQSATGKVESPGMKYKHYAPKAEALMVYSENENQMIELIKENLKENTAIIGFQEHKKFFPDQPYYAYGHIGNLDEVMHNIFTLLRQVDRQKPNFIIIEGVKKEGLGIAIMNRLIRSVSYHYIEK